MRRNTRRWFGLIVLIGLIVGGPDAWAQEVDVVTEETRAEVTSSEVPAEYLGWDLYFRLGANFALASAKNVVGAVNGQTWTFGSNLHFGWYFQSPTHEWRNDIRMLNAFARTPIVDEFVKANDLLNYLSLYMYRLPNIPWFGPFARFRFNTQIFEGVDVRAEPTQYAIDGVPLPSLQTRLFLTDVFQPLTLRETAGVFFSPETEPAAQFEALVGFGARQTFADNQLAVADDDTTADVIEVQTLRSFNQAGSELILRFWGEVDEGLITYETGAGMMTPFINDLQEGDDRNAWELTNWEFFANISIHPYDWLSVDYVFLAIKDPELLDEWQITNQLLIGIGYTLIERQHPES